jgi:hypothetical protein
MNILNTVFQHHSLIAQPPVLLDIGASTGLPKLWRAIAKYSICVAFDPDRRQMEYIESERGFKQLYIFPAVVHADTTGQAVFQLAASPECSSMLPPNMVKLQDYLFAHLFTTVQTAMLPAATITQILSDLKLDYVDWFKTDSQGTDLRLFKSVPEHIRQKIIAAEFEPGIIDAYLGEDKMWQIMQYMAGAAFWCSSFRVLQTPRINADFAKRYFSRWQQRLLNTILPKAPGWTEIMFLNDFSGSGLTEREFLLGYVFAMEQRQYGEALRLAELGAEKFADPIFPALRRHSLNKIKRQCWFSPALLLKIFQKIATVGR